MCGGVGLYGRSLGDCVARSAPPIPAIALILTVLALVGARPHGALPDPIHCESASPNLIISALQEFRQRRDNNPQRQHHPEL